MCGKAQHLVSSENVLLGQEQRCFVTFSPTFLGVSLHLSSYPSSHFWYGDFSHLGTWGSIALGSSFLSLFAVLSYLHILAVLVRHLLTLLPMCIGHLALLLVGGGALLLALRGAHLQYQGVKYLAQYMAQYLFIGRVTVGLLVSLAALLVCNVNHHVFIGLAPLALLYSLPRGIFVLGSLWSVRHFLLCWCEGGHFLAVFGWDVSTSFLRNS